MKYLFIQDRESEMWFCKGYMPWETTHEYVGNSMRRKRVRKQKTWVYPKPEFKSAFVMAHKIIEAETEEIAWQTLSSK